MKPHLLIFSDPAGGECSTLSGSDTAFVLRSSVGFTYG